jgi:hypothetical protein
MRCVAVTGEDQLMTQKDKPDHKHLADTYRETEASDAVHHRDADRGKDATINVTPEEPGKPLSDVARPDKADGENHAAPPSPKGPEYDKLMRGYEPGEMAGEQ